MEVYQCKNCGKPYTHEPFECYKCESKDKLQKVTDYNLLMQFVENCFDTFEKNHYYANAIAYTCDAGWELLQNARPEDTVSVWTDFNQDDTKYKVRVRKNSIINFDEDLKEYECRVGGVQLIGEVKDSFIGGEQK